jgi:hypothetical protein
MTGCAVEPPCQAHAGCFAPLVDVDVAESVLRGVVPEAPQDDEGFEAQRPVPPEERAGEILVVRCDGTGVPMIQEEAVKLQATWGPGETRQKNKAALVGLSDTVDPKLRSPEAWAALLVDPEAARARRQRDHVPDDAPRAPQGRRVASLVCTKPAVMAGIKADAKRRDPQPRQRMVVRLDGARGLSNLAPTLFPAWKRVMCVLDIMPVGGSHWAAANALGGDASQAGKRWVQRKLGKILRGLVG